VLLSPFEQHTLRADRRFVFDMTWTKMNKTHMMQVSDLRIILIVFICRRVTAVVWLFAVV
jgi:hypothetical protein